MEIRPAANAAPSFPDGDDEVAGIQTARMVDETAKVGSSIGDPVAATDSDNDPLLYGLVDYDDPYQGDLDDDGLFGDTFTEENLGRDVNGDGTIDNAAALTEEDLDRDFNGDGTIDTAEVLQVEEVDDSQWFKIDGKTGQVSVTSTMSQDDVTKAFDQDVETPTEEFMVKVTATDPSGAMGDITVTIEVEAIDEAPAIASANKLPAGLSLSAGTDPFNVKTEEERQLNPEGIGSGDSLAENLPILEATDPEAALASELTLKDERITWSLSGVDAKRFAIVKLPDTHNNAEPSDETRAGAAGIEDDPDTEGVNEAVGGFFVTVNDVGTVTSVIEGTEDAIDLRLDGKVKGALRFTTPYPNFEAMDSADGDNVYEVVVRVSDGNESKTQTVTVTVENVEEAGTVSLSQRSPQEGIPVTASLSDKDGNITGTEWQWYKSDVKIGDNFSRNHCYCHD